MVMKPVAAVVMLATLLSGATASEAGEHPIAKIIAMLEGLKAKAREDGESEAVSHQKFEYWCKNSKKELSAAIKQEQADIETLEDKIDAKAKLNETLTKEIASLEEELQKMATSGDNAQKIRDEQNTDYDAADTDYDATIKAIDECITLLSKTKSETDSLLAKQSVRKVLAIAEALLSTEEKATVVGFLQQDQKPTKPDAKVYTFKSGGVVELLKKLKAEFETERLEATKGETNSLNSFNLAKDAREQAVKAAEKSRDEKATIKGEAESDLASLREDLTQTQDDLAKDEKTLAETTSECDLKAEEWTTRSATREQEIEALDMAIKILAKVGGVRAPGAEESPASFLQIDDPKAKAVKILVAEAQKLHSRSLQRLAQQITAHLAGPFDDVNQMIQKMIFRLMAEQKDEDDHKNWCDMELEKSTESKDDKEGKKEELDNKIAEAEAKTVELADEIATLEEEAAAIRKHVQEATAIRDEEHTENMATIKDSQDAQTAISSAIAVLTAFYKESGKTPKEPWEFLQMGGRAPVVLDAPPSTWDASYTGLDSEPDGILSLLEKTSADFSKMEADTKAQEDEDQKAYDEDMTTSAIDKAEKEKSGEMKTQERARLLDKLKTWQGQLKHVVSELEAVTQYLKDLEPACVNGDSTYEDRKQARADEIEALRKAQVILEEAFKAKDGDTAPALLQRRSSLATVSKNHHHQAVSDAPEDSLDELSADEMKAYRDGQSDEDKVTGVYDMRHNGLIIEDTPEKMDPEWRAEQNLKKQNEVSGRGLRGNSNNNRDDDN